MTYSTYIDSTNFKLFRHQHINSCRWWMLCLEHRSVQIDGRLWWHFPIYHWTYQGQSLTPLMYIRGFHGQHRDYSKIFKMYVHKHFYHTTECDQYRIAGVVVCINFMAKTWHVGAVSIYNMFLYGRLIRILRLRWTARHTLGEFIPWKPTIFFCDYGLFCLFVCWVICFQSQKNSTVFWGGFSRLLLICHSCHPWPVTNK